MDLKEKWDLLKEYLSYQARDHEIWFEADYITEGLLQAELRRVAWMVEEATPEQMREEIERCKVRVQDWSL